MPGMYDDASGMRCIDVDGPDSLWAHDEDRMWRHVLDGQLPDPEDDATRGCLLRLVRDAWGCPDLTTTAGGDFDGGLVWEIETVRAMGLGGILGATEAEALVAALLAAP